MAPNPSAALRVLLAGLIAAGPAPAYAARQDQPAPPGWAGKTESWPAWHMFSVPGVGTVYCHYTACGGAGEAQRRANAHWYDNALTWARRRSGREPVPVIGTAVAQPGTPVPVYTELSQSQTGGRVDAVFAPSPVRLVWNGSTFQAMLPDGRSVAVYEQSMLSNTDGTLVVRLGQAPAAPPPAPAPPRHRHGPHPPLPAPAPTVPAPSTGTLGGTQPSTGTIGGVPPSTGTAVSAFDRKLEQLFDDKVERAFAEVVSGFWDGTRPEADARRKFEADLDAALAGDAAKKQAFLTKAQGAILGAVRNHLLDPRSDPPTVGPAMQKHGVSDDDLKRYACDPRRRPAAAGAPLPSTTTAMGQAVNTDRGGRAGAAAGGGEAAVVSAGGGIDGARPNIVAANAPMAPADPLEPICRAFQVPPAAQVPGGGGTTAPPPTPGPGDIKADKEKDDSATKAAAKKKLDLQRAVVGGIGGALVLGVFGFIFGGPIGAIAMGAVGFAVMAGVSYMNNNPIGGG